MRPLSLPRESRRAEPPYFARHRSPRGTEACRDGVLRPLGPLAWRLQAQGTQPKYGSEGYLEPSPPACILVPWAAARVAGERADLAYESH